MQLPKAAIDKDDIREQFGALARFAIATAHHFAHGTVIVVLRTLNAIAAVGVLEWSAVNKAHFAANRFCAAEVGNIDRFHAANGTIETKRALQAARTDRGITGKDSDLWLPVILFAAAGFPIVKFRECMNLIAQYRSILKALLR